MSASELICLRENKTAQVSEKILQFLNLLNEKHSIWCEIEISFTLNCMIEIDFEDQEAILSVTDFLHQE